MERPADGASDNLPTGEVKLSEKSVELSTPVEDHFQPSKEESKQDDTQETHDEQPLVSRGDKLKAFTKKLKFWTRTDRTSNDAMVSEDTTNVATDNAAPKSIDDEIEAILSAPKKTKQAEKQPSMRPSADKLSDEVTAVEPTSRKDHSLLTKKKELVTTTTASVKTSTPKPTIHEVKELKDGSNRKSPMAEITPPVKPKPVIAVKPKPSSKPQLATKPQAHITPIQKEQPLTPVSLLKQLEQKAEENDYYQLLGVEESASVDEIARRRRERSRELHPDHFMTDAIQKAKLVSTILKAPHSSST